MQPIDCKPIYRDGKHYDLQNSDHTSDIPFYLNRAKKIDGQVLEIACGTGRITIPLAKAGIDITGLDLSSSMLSYAREKSKAASLSIKWVQADCRNFDLGSKFNFMFIPFNSMQHLHDQESLERFLGCVKQHLALDGVFILDVFNPSISILARDPSKRYSVTEYDDPDGKGRIVIEETTIYDDATQVNRIKWHFSIGNQRDQQVEELNLRCFYPQELDMLLYYNGFGITEKIGNFDGKPFTKGSPKQIVVCNHR